MTVVTAAFSLALLLAFISSTTLVLGDDDRMTVFEVPDRPEGITEGPGSTLFVGQILSGKVLSIDVLTGDTKEVVGQQDGRQAWGLWYYENSIFVAGGGTSFGGGTAEVYLYDVDTGSSLVSCAPISLNEFGNFLNDVTVRDDVAYITDSVNGKLMAMNATKALQGECDVWEVDLSKPFDPIQDDDFGANGIVSYADGLLVCHEIDGSVWYITNILKRGETPVFQEVIGDGGVPGADGLTILENKLYVTQNTENVVSVFELAFRADQLMATQVEMLVSDDFATPATSAIYDGYVYSTNSRFVEQPDISEPANNTVIGVVDPTTPTAAPTTSEASTTKLIPMLGLVLGNLFVAWWYASL